MTDKDSRFTEIVKSYMAAGLTIKIWPEFNNIHIKVSKSMPKDRDMDDMLDNLLKKTGVTMDSEGVSYTQVIPMFDHHIQELVDIVEYCGAKVLNEYPNKPERTTLDND